MPSDDIFKNIREAVSQSLEMAEAESKISDETKDVLAELTLTRRGDGEIMLDISALDRLKTADNEWTNSNKSVNDNLVNPTRLPQLVPGLNGLQSSQYLAFVQRPLELNGDNGQFLERKSKKLFEQYQAKELAKERTQLFGNFQRFIANLLINEVLKKENPNLDQSEIDKLREKTPPQDQFGLAAKAIGVSTSEVMNRLFKYAVALHIIEGIKTKALRIEKAKPIFETALKKLAAQDTGPTSKTRIKEMFLGFQSDLEKMLKTSKTFHQKLSPIIEQSSGEQFDKTYSDLHREAAKLDALVTKWIIIIGEANNTKDPRSPVDKIKGMHKVYEG